MPQSVRAAQSPPGDRARERERGRDTDPLRQAGGHARTALGLLAICAPGCVLISDADIAEKEAYYQDSLLTRDLDKDGFAAAADCDDDDPEIYPGATEWPNRKDDDCDGRADNGTFLYDDDGDGFCETAPCAQPAPGVEIAGGDCDDAQPSVYPGADEVCDGIRNDCDRSADEHGDLDGDGSSIAQGDPDDRDRAQQPAGAQITLAAMTCDVARIEPGSFTQGCEESWCFAEEAPAHKVSLTRPFLMMNTEVTLGYWDVFLSRKNWAFISCGESCPVSRVSWFEALEFANALNDWAGLPRCEATDDPRTCTGWRLPTEAEWEYAARADTTDRYAGSSNPALVGWTAENSQQTVHQVGLKQANSLGIFDLTGNVAEWTWDLHQYYSSAAQTDPVSLSAETPTDTVERRIKGGSGYSPATYAHVSARSELHPTEGFADEDIRDTNPTNAYNWVGFRLVRYAP